MQSPLDQQTKKGLGGFLTRWRKKNQESFEDVLKDICRSGKLSDTTVTTRDSRCLKTHTKPTQTHASECSAPQQNPSERVSNASTLATCPYFH